MKPHQVLAVVCLLLACLLIAVDQGWIDRSVIPTPEPPKPAVVWAVVVEESGERTAEQARVLMSPEVRELFPKFRLVDADDSVEPRLTELIERAKAKGLPRLFLIDPEGTVHWEGDVPLTVDGWRQLVQEVKA